MAYGYDEGVSTQTSSSLLPDVKAAQHLPFSVYTLRSWRRAGRGPAYLKISGRIFYRLEDIEAWLASRPRGGEVPGVGGPA